MSNRYKGGVISATPPTTTGGEDGTASGAWTLEQQMQLTAAGLWPIQPLPKYIEDVFSTYLYTGNGSTQTITNGIDLSTKGGLVWIKARTDTSGGATSHALVDTVRGSSKWLSSNTGSAQATNVNLVTGFTSSGFSVGTAPYFANESSIPYVSWTFREQPKFFDIVTFTGDGTTTGRDIPHNLGSAPGCIIVKRTDDTSNWTTYHRESAVKAIALNSSGASYGTLCWGSVAPTSTNFTVRLETAASTDRQININGATYVAYLFAHDAGGFGLTGTENVISCGSYTGNGSASGPEVTLGYEPQWLMVKQYREGGAAGNWQILDIMRGMPVSSADATLQANLSNAETNVNYISPTATGFNVIASNSQVNASGDIYIYIAIRRGPMKVPTSGTSVFSPVARAGTSATATVTAGFPVDMTIIQDRTQNSFGTPFDRLRGATNRLFTALTLAEASEPTSLTSFAVQTGFTLGTDLGFGAVNTSGDNYINWNFRRAPGFFDEVCYTSSAYTDLIYHNLGVAPEMIIAKNRGATATQWYIHHTGMGASEEIYFNADAKSAGSAWTRTSTYWNNSSALFPLGEAHVAYLFATCAGVSKVGSYTGTATTLQIDCGFTGGSRFVLIKRTDSTGDWYVWDSARGIVAGNDPYLLLNSTAAEVTNTDYVDTYSAGFEITSTAPAAINANGGTFIFLAIA